VKDLCPIAHVKGCKMLGLEIKTEPVYRGQPGVVVLARCFSPNVWYGDVNSCSDIARALSKLHVTKHLPHACTPVDKLVEKCRSLVLSDSLTPVLGPFARRVVQLSSGLITHESAHTLGSYLTQGFEQNEQFPQEDASWMTDLLIYQLPDFDVHAFFRFLRNTICLIDMLSPPLCCETRPAKPQSAPVYVDGNIIIPSIENPKVHPMREKKSPPTVKFKPSKLGVKQPVEETPLPRITRQENYVTPVLLQPRTSVTLIPKTPMQLAKMKREGPQPLPHRISARAIRNFGKEY
jgi:hypothetical protein